jgi:hypothetical protein
MDIKTINGLTFCCAKLEGLGELLGDEGQESFNLTAKGAFGISLMLRDIAAEIRKNMKQDYIIKNTCSTQSDIKI